MPRMAGAIIGAMIGCTFSTRLPVGANDAAIDGQNVDTMDAVAACPASYMAIATQTSRYRVVTTSATWTAAQTDCADDGAGTHLAIPQTQPEDVALADAISGASASGWLGVSDRITEGMFRIVTGGTTYYVDWYTGASLTQPDNDGDCVEIISGTASQTAARGKHFDASCTATRPYVCECDGISPDPTAF